MNTKQYNNNYYNCNNFYFDNKGKQPRTATFQRGASSNEQRLTCDEIGEIARVLRTSIFRPVGVKKLNFSHLPDRRTNTDGLRKVYQQTISTPLRLEGVASSNQECDLETMNAVSLCSVAALESQYPESTRANPVPVQSRIICGEYRRVQIKQVYSKTNVEFSRRTSGQLQYPRKIQITKSYAFYRKPSLVCQPVRFDKKVFRYPKNQNADSQYDTINALPLN